jgi:mannosyltransferase
MTTNLGAGAARTRFWGTHLAISFLLLAGFVLRAYHLDYQSFWSDEGISLLRSAQPLGQMLARMPIEHTPGYFVLLHFWLQLAGDTDFATRYLSLLPSVWAIALIYRLGVDLGSRWVGLVAALLLATHPFQVWYAQEARMYSWLMATSALATLAFWRLLLVTGLRNESKLPWATAVLYALATAATLYLHYFGFLLPLVHTGFALFWLAYRRDWRWFKLWVSAGLGVLLLFAPWLGRVYALFAFPGWREDLAREEIPWMLWEAYTVGETMPAPWDDWLPWLYAVLVGVGIFVWLRRRPVAAYFLGITLAATVLAIALLVVREPDIHPRYTMPITIPVLLLVSIALVGPATRRWVAVGAGAALLLVAANGLALQELYTNERLHKPNFRAVAGYIEAEAEAGDMILVDGPDPELVFMHYYDGEAPVHDLRALDQADVEEVERTLAELTNGATRAWEVLMFHHPGPVQRWLATQGWATVPEDYNGLRLLLYGLPSDPMIEQELGLYFGPELELVRAGVGAATLEAGDLLRVTTHWFVHAPLPDYKFSMRLQDRAGNVVLANDYVPQNWFAPTSIWLTGQPASDRHGLLIPGTLPAGDYRVTLRLYDPANGVAVETDAGQDVLLAEVNVTAMPVRAELGTVDSLND